MHSVQPAEMRSAHIQENLHTVQLLGPTAEAAVLANLSPATRTLIENATRVAWLPLAVDIELTEAVGRAAGSGAVYEWSRRAFQQSADSPLLSPLLSAARALFGLTPAGLYRWSDKLWMSIYRGCGTIRAERSGPHEMLLVNEGAPEEMMQSRTYCEGIAGAGHAVIDLCKTGGRITLEIEPKARRVVYFARWHPYQRRGTSDAEKRAET